MKYTEEEIEKWAKQYSKMLGMIEEDLKLPSGFLTALNHEDDWSFIIKSHALIEAALSNHLSKSIDSKLEPIFDKLELSNSRTGKLAFAEALGVLDSKQRMFIRKLSELRNTIVHNIHYINFDLKSYFMSLDKKQRDSFIEAFTYIKQTPKGEKAWKPSALKILNKPYHWVSFFY